MGLTLSSSKEQQHLGLHLQVAHFTPSSFPLMPIFTRKSNACCQDSWRKIITYQPSENLSQEHSGITRFYNEFYARLDAIDQNGEFDMVLTNNGKGKNKIFKKGSLIIRIVDFILKIDGDTKELQERLGKLGKAHIKMNIHPWQYSIFIETLLLTISSCLREEASFEVMESWVNLFALTLKYMLPAVLKVNKENSDFIASQYCPKMNRTSQAPRIHQIHEVIKAEDLQIKNNTNITHQVSISELRYQQFIINEACSSTCLTDDMQRKNCNNGSAQSTLLIPERNCQNNTIHKSEEKFDENQYSDNYDHDFPLCYSWRRSASNPSLHSMPRNQSIQRMGSSEEYLFDQYVDIGEDDSNAKDENSDITASNNSYELSNTHIGQTLPIALPIQSKKNNSSNVIDFVSQVNAIDLYGINSNNMDSNNKEYLKKTSVASPSINNVTIVSCEKKWTRAQSLNSLIHRICFFTDLSSSSRRNSHSTDNLDVLESSTSFRRKTIMNCNVVSLKSQKFVLPLNSRNEDE